jgi:hypothetical protein
MAEGSGARGTGGASSGHFDQAREDPAVVERIKAFDRPRPGHSTTQHDALIELVLLEPTESFAELTSRGTDDRHFAGRREFE